MTTPAACQPVGAILVRISGFGLRVCLLLAWFSLQLGGRWSNLDCGRSRLNLGWQGAGEVAKLDRHARLWSNGFHWSIPAVPGAPGDRQQRPAMVGRGAGLHQAQLSTEDGEDTQRLSPAKRIPRQWFAGLALAVVTLAVYWPVRNHAFINYDDPVYVTENRHVQAGISRPGLEWAFLNLHGEHTYWHPVTWVSHMVDCQLFGLNPGPHHLINVAFHVANALLVLLVLHRMTGAFWRSTMVAGLFALHPLQVDTVAWVTERKNVLSTFCWLLTLWAWVRYVEVQRLKTKVQGLKAESRRPKAEGSPRSEARTQDTENTRNSAVPSSRLDVRPSSPSLWYWLAVLLFGVGLMCKPALVTLPFVLLLLDYWPLGRMQNEECRMQKAKGQSPASRITLPVSRLTLLVEKLPFLVLAGAAAFITLAGHHELRSEGSAGLP